MDEILISVKVLPPSIYFKIERIVRDLDLQFIAALIPFAAVSLVQLSRYGRPSVGPYGWV